MGFTAGDDVDFAMPGLQDGDREACGAAEAEESYPLAGLHTGDAQAAVADDARAQQRRDLCAIEAGGKGKCEVVADQNVFGVAAVDGVSGEGGVVAEVLHSVAAVPTIAIG